MDSTLNLHTTNPHKPSPLFHLHSEPKIRNGKTGHATFRRDQPRYEAILSHHIDEIPQLQKLPAELRFSMKVVASVLPFRANPYVIDHLIDWSRVPEDPVFQLIFPQAGMLSPEDFERVATLLSTDAPKSELQAHVADIRASLNPHPGDQMALNVPSLDNESIEGIQHKYIETVLFFPSQGQTCQAYCSFCFRWAQFVGDKDLRFASTDAKQLQEYLAANRSVTDLLLTGGDPMVMKTSTLASYLLPLAEDPRLSHVQDIRIGSKSLTYWPYRFVSDPDSDEMLRLLEHLVKAGKHVAFMAHFNHWREFDTEIAREAIRRIRNTGAVIRSQAPLLAHINDDADVWSRMWQEQVRLGIVPYYMFVERDTGARCYFEVPLVRAHDIYSRAVRTVSGLARTAQGPVMSAAPGKVQVLGVTHMQGEKVFTLRFLQGRNPEWVGNVFFARFDENATWLDQLKPAFGEKKFFFEDEFEAMKKRRSVAAS